jgi:hypothetical protein
VWGALLTHQLDVYSQNNDIVGNSHGGGGAVDSRSVRIFSEDPADSMSRQLARYIRDVAGKFVPGHLVRLIAREDRFGRGGDHTAYNRLGFTAVRITESKENYSRQHSLADTLDGVDFEYLVKNARVNAAALFSLAAAPAAPVVRDAHGPMLSRGGIAHGDPEQISSLRNYDATLKWFSVPEAVQYRVVLRGGWALDWERSVVVTATTEPMKTHTLLNVSIDDFIFGVSAIGANGFESLVSPFIRPPGAWELPPVVNKNAPSPTSSTGLPVAPKLGDVLGVSIGFLVGGMVGFASRKSGWQDTRRYAGLARGDVEE